MTQDDRLKFCKICENREMNSEVGLVCSLTNEKPRFEDSCPSFYTDKIEADRLGSLSNRIKQEEKNSAIFGSDSAIPKRVVAGLAMIIAAIVWFVLGMAGGYILYSPPILLMSGVYILVRGMTSRR
jgi:hypothetical protein